MSSEYVEIKYISYTTVLRFSKKFILLFVPESFSTIILSYPFSKLLFSPTFLRISFRKKTGRLVEHDFVLFLQNVYFPTLLAKLNQEHSRDEIYFLRSYIQIYSLFIRITPQEHSAYSFKMRTCNYKIPKIMKITEVYQSINYHVQSTVTNSYYGAQR